MPCALQVILDVFHSPDSFRVCCVLCTVAPDHKMSLVPCLPRACILICSRGGCSGKATCCQNNSPLGDLWWQKPADIVMGVDELPWWAQVFPGYGGMVFFKVYIWGAEFRMWKWVIVWSREQFGFSFSLGPWIICYEIELGSDEEFALTQHSSCLEQCLSCSEP